MKHWMALGLACGLLMMSCSTVSNLIATPTPTPTRTPTPTSTFTPTSTATATQTYTPSPTEPSRARLEVEVDEVFPCFLHDNMCEWSIKIYFRELDGVGVDIESVAWTMVDTKGEIWFLDVDRDGKGDEWFDEYIRIDPLDETRYPFSIASKIGGTPDFRNARVEFGWKGMDDKGKRVRGAITFYLGEPDA